MKRWMRLPILSLLMLPLGAQAHEQLMPDEISVLVLYTPGVTVYHNGRDGAEAHIYSMIANANQAFENSEATIRLKLAHAQEIEYYEAIEPKDDLDRLWYPDDGYLDEASSLRMRYGADLVTLLRRERGASSSGRAYILTDATGNDNIAYNVVTTESSISGFLFAHEIGHNLGAGHQKEDSNPLGLFDYSHAHEFEAEGPKRTIMYSHYSRGSIPHFSNPDILYKSHPTGEHEGLEEANNALTISKIGKRIAEYRSDPVNTFAILDSNLEMAIRQELGKAEGALSAFDMAMLTNLDAPASGIKELSGLEAAINLSSIDLRNNEIEDIATLTRLENLDTIDISGNHLNLANGSPQKRIADQLAQSGKSILMALQEPALRRSEIVSISARGFSGIGDAMLAIGFTLHGKNSADFEFRGTGPSLEHVGGVTSVLRDPSIHLYKGSSLLAENASWRRTGSATLPSNLNQDQTTDLGESINEPAMGLNLGSGVYGLLAQSENRSTGIALLEVYQSQLTPQDNDKPQFINLSARGHVGSGEEQLIVGFRVRGAQPINVIIRASGIKSDGLEGLADPRIAIIDLSTMTTIGDNDNWQDSHNPLEINHSLQAVGGIPLREDSSEAAVALQLPGDRNYAILASGVNGSTGLGLVEMFLAEN